MNDILTAYFMRHQNNINLALHVVGIPLVLIGAFLLFKKRWAAALSCVAIGYALQFMGHFFFEHNQMGEWSLILKFINRITGK